MSFETTPNDLETLFSQAGKVVGVIIPTDRSTGRPRGFAFVEFAEQADATQAIEKFDGYELQGASLRVNVAEPRQRRPGGFVSPRPGSGPGPGPGPEPGFGPDPFGPPRNPRASRPKGSRRGIRGRKRGF